MLSATPFSLTVSRSFCSDMVIFDTDCWITLSIVTLNLKTLIAASSAACAQTDTAVTIVPWLNSLSRLRHACIISSAPKSQHSTPSTADCILYSFEMSVSVLLTAFRLMSSTM